MVESPELEEINGVVLEDGTKRTHHRQTLDGVLQSLMAAILGPDSGSSAASAPPLHRIKVAFSEHAPLLPEAFQNTGLDVLHWARSGSPFRALLVISVGTIIFLALTGLLFVMLFFVAATINAIIISLLISLAVAGGFLAFFFACVTAIYIGALSVAVFVISTVTVWATIAVLITTGWIGFLWAVWLVVKKIVGLAKHSLNETVSAISVHPAAPNHHSGNVSD
ncbi:uncharacterized protein LOC131160293 [Malania oleifera]|uniref:uncharacterized protein LOC131160293 n=1 Tax=Malania oleifera TaxID=397392 RepID=UPI0025AE4CCF|nr:uncharacterized protein LOC131160293 [Malania oleifera]